jgi:hypothetical protein
MINRDTPVGLPAGNGILYSQADSGGASQLRWYNGATDVAITPPIANAPFKVTGSVVLASDTTSGTVYTVPANSQGTIFVNYISPAGNFYRYYMFYRSSTATVGSQLILDSPNTGKPDIRISGADLKVYNGNDNTRTVGYWINVVSF